MLKIMRFSSFYSVVCFYFIGTGIISVTCDDYSIPRTEFYEHTPLLEDNEHAPLFHNLAALYDDEDSTSLEGYEYYNGSGEGGDESVCTFIYDYEDYNGSGEGGDENVFIGYISPSNTLIYDEVNSIEHSFVQFSIKPPETYDQIYNGCEANILDADNYILKYYTTRNESFQISLRGDIFWINRVRHNAPTSVGGWRVKDLDDEQFTIMDINFSSSDQCFAVNITSLDLIVTRCDILLPRFCVQSRFMDGGSIEIPYSDPQIIYSHRQMDKLIFMITGSKPYNQNSIKIECFSDQYKIRRIYVCIGVTENPWEFAFEPTEDDYYHCVLPKDGNIKQVYFTSQKVLFIRDNNRYSHGYVIMTNYNSVYLHNQSSLALITLLASPARMVFHYFGNLDNLYRNDHMLFLKENIIFVRKILTCEALDFIPETEYGKKVLILEECKEYSCEGDFYYGSWWNITDLKGCIPNTSPEEQIEKVQNKLEDILKGPINSTSLATVAAMVNKIISYEGNEISTNIIKKLESMVFQTILPVNESYVKTIQPKLAIVVAESRLEKPILGIEVSNVPNLTSSSVNLIYSDSSVGESENSNIFVNVSAILKKNSSSRISFIVFGDNMLFRSSKISKNNVNTHIISVQQENVSNLEENAYIDIHFRPNKKIKEYETKVCVFWDFELGSTGEWSTEGCELLSAAGQLEMDTCRCSHLTHFAQLIIKNGREIKENDYKVLTIISYIGCMHSLVGLLIVALTGALFKSWRQDLVHQLWLNLSAAIGLMILTMLFISIYEFQRKNVYLCVVSGVILHYSVLSTFCWMFVIATVYFQMTVNVLTAVTYDESVLTIFANLVGWLVPTVPIIFLFIVDSKNYSFDFLTNLYQQRNFCYPSKMGWWLTVFLPACAVVICNTLLFVYILFSVYSNSKIKKHGGRHLLSISSVKIFFILFYQFGAVWLFGLLSSNVVMAYLFCILGTMQGMVLCYFFVIGNKKTRELWLTKLGMRGTKRVPGSDYCAINDQRSASRRYKISRMRNTESSDLPLSSIPSLVTV